MPMLLSFFHLWATYIPLSAGQSEIHKRTLINADNIFEAYIIHSEYLKVGIYKSAMYFQFGESQLTPLFSSASK